MRSFRLALSAALRLAALLLLAGFGSAISAAAASTATVVPSAGSYESTGGQLTFTVTLAYSGALSGLDLELTTPSGWKYASTAGTNIPQTVPSADDLGTFGFAFIYSTVPTTSPASFTFTVSYPANMTGEKVLTGIRASFTDEATSAVQVVNVPNITITAPGGSTGTQAQTITFAGLAGKTFGAAPFAVAATSSSSLPVTISVLSGPATISSGTVTVTGAGTVVLRATQAGNATYAAATPVDQSFTVAKATPVITWPTPASGTAGTTLGATQLNAAASVPGSFTYTPAAGTVLTAGSQTLTATFTPNDSADYNGATAAVTLSVLSAGSAPTITTQPQSQTTTVGGSATFTVVASGTGPFTYQWRKGGVNISGATNASYTITGVQSAASGSYDVVVGNTTGSVTSAAATLTVSAAAASTATVVPSAGSYQSTGGQLTFTVTLAYSGALSGLDLELTTPSGWKYASTAGTNIPQTVPSADDLGTFGFAFIYSTVPATSPASFTFTVSYPANMTGEKVLTGIRASFTDEATSAVQVVNVPNITITAPGGSTGTQAQTITFASLAGKTFGAAPFAVAATSSSSLPVTISVLSGPATISSGTVTVTGAGTVVLRATQAGNATYAAATPVDQSFTVAKATPVITWPIPASVTAGTTLGAMQLNATASVPGSFTYTPAAGTVLTAGSQTLTATFTPNDSADYNGATAAVTLSVLSAGSAPTITTQLQSQTTTAGGSATFTVVASGTGPFTYQWRKGGVNISGATNASYTITGVQSAASGSYDVVVGNTAGSVTSAAATLTVSAAAASTATVVPSAGSYQSTGGQLTFTVTLAYSGALSGLDLELTTPSGWKYASTAGTNIPQTVPSADDLGTFGFAFIYSTVPATSPASFTFTVSYPANMTGEKVLTGIRASFTDEASSAVQVVNVPNITIVAPAGGTSTPQTITFASLPAKTFGDAPFALGATASSGLAVTYASSNTAAATVSGNTVTIVGAGSATITASQAGNANYSAATIATQTLTVNKAAATVTLGNLAATYDGTPKAASATTTPSGLTVNLTYEGSATAPTSAGTYAVVGTMADANYAGSVSGMLLIAKANQTITFGALTAKTAGDAPFPLGATASSGLGVTYASSNPAVATVVGNTVTIVGAGSATISASQAGDGNYSAATPVPQTLLVTSPSFAPVVALTSETTNAYVTTGGTGTYRVRITYTGQTPSGMGVSLSLPAGWTFVSYSGPSPTTQPSVGDNVLEWAYSNFPSNELTFTLTVNYPTGQSGTKSVMGAVNYRPGPVTLAFANLNLTAVVPPSITTQPVSRLAGVGTGSTFTVGASGTAPLSYQWTKNGSALADGGNVSGATTATLSLSSLTVGDAANYTAVVTNAGGTATSNAATLTVIDALVTHAVVGAGYIAGGTVTLTQTLTYTGSCSGLGWQMLLPAGWSYAASGGSEGDVKPSLGATSLLEWAWTNVPVSPVTFTATLNVPVGETGDRSVTSLSVFRVSAGAANLLVTPDPLVVSPITTHSADTNSDFKLSLFELTRVIELYNTRNGSSRTGCYAVATTATEDGFAPAAARLSTATVSLARYHAGDSNRDGKLSLFELTRVIELYNVRSGTSRTGAYHAQGGTEDGFAPGP